jgi:D-alanyl-D-alanine carboxypeptidase
MASPIRHMIQTTRDVPDQPPLGQDTTDPASPSPSHSEHQTGRLSTSVTAAVCAALRCFTDQPSALWAKANSHRFGFIVRYPEGAEHLTSYAYEPWHLRFVGTEAATEIHGRDITLEEYLDATG